MYSPMLMMVEIFDNHDDEKAAQSYLVDYAHPPTRQWMERLVHFSVLNKKSMNIDPASKEDLQCRSIYVPRDKKEATTV